MEVTDVRAALGSTVRFKLLSLRRMIGLTCWHTCVAVYQRFCMSGGHIVHVL